MKDKCIKVIKIIAIIGSVLAALKLIFVDYSMDEEYQLMMSYRILSGDISFGNMWEPHQTSAFVCTFLMGIYKFIAGSYDGVLLFVRVATLLIQLLLVLWLYRCLKKYLSPEYSFWISLISFNIVPKLIQIPEFGNLQLWFVTIILLALCEKNEAEDKIKKYLYLILAGVSMSLLVLVYPSSILILPAILIYLFLTNKEKGWVDEIIFIGTCGVMAACWLISHFMKVPPKEFIRNVQYVLSFDLTHSLDVTANNKVAIILKGAMQAGAMSIGLLAAALITYMLLRIKNNSIESTGKTEAISIIVVLTIVFSGILQLVLWVVFSKGFEYTQLHLLLLLIFGVLLCRKGEKDDSILKLGVIVGVILFVAVLYMSDLDFFYAIPHALIGVIFALVLIVKYLQSALQEKSRGAILLLLISLAFVSMFGKGFTLRSGRGNNILSVSGIMKEGMAKGVLADYMCAYIYNSNYEDFTANVEEESKCLIVTNMVFSPGTTPYSFVDASVCHFSIVDPTSYDERLLEYWSMYPDKQPDVIVVDCWYGQLMEDKDSYIMNYINNEFDYNEVVDGKYVRFYKR